MDNKDDIFSKFYSQHFGPESEKNKSFNKKSIYLTRFYMFLRDNNPKNIIQLKINDKNATQKLLYDKKNIKKRENDNQSRNTFSLGNNVNDSNNENSKNKTSINFNSIDSQLNSKIKAIKSYNEKSKKANSSLNSKLLIQKEIDDETNKIFNYFINSDLSRIRNVDFNLNKKKTYRFNKVKKDSLIDQKLLKMKTIKHRLIIGEADNFRSIHIQNSALGNDKNRKKLIFGVQDYLKNKPFNSIKSYRMKNTNNEINKITKEFVINDLKSRRFLILNQKPKRKLNKTINNYSLFHNKDKAKMNKTEYMNFYQKINLIHDKVLKTHDYLLKKIENRKKYKINISNLFKFQ